FINGEFPNTGHCRYGSLPGQLKLVELNRSTHCSGLGLCVTGSRDRARGRMSVYVSEVQPEGAAAADGRIRVGDELLEINGQVLYGRSHQNASAIINSAPSEVKLVLNSPFNVLSNHKPFSVPSSAFRSRSASPIPPGCYTLPMSHSTSTSPTQNFHLSHTQCCSLTSHSDIGLPGSSCCPSYSMNTDPLKCPIIPGHLNTIELCKGHSGLGLSIVGGCNTLMGVILIHEVNEGGAAHRDGRLLAGDQILEVNGIDLRMATHEEALSVLRLSPQRVSLCVYRHPSTHNFPKQATHTHEDMWDLFIVDLQLGPGQELGMSIVGKRDDTGIFLSEITNGGVVQLDGRLSLGDQILSVNGEDIRAVTQVYARTLLQVFHTPQHFFLINGKCMCIHFSSQYKTISLERGSAGLGFSIAGGSRSSHGYLPIYIKNIFPKGAAVEDGRLRSGDRLVAVNGRSLEGISHSEAAEILRRARGAVTLTILSQTHLAHR
uniref:PDZ domain-containing protein n=1 Tax=Pygocentrus nattereri TaxID=42514 RepID=A0AAR2IQP5_PYGNA